MNILLVADQESRYIWDYYTPERFKDVDIILSAGDLKASYVEFLTTVMKKQLYYVYGNHDTKYLDARPGGCMNIDDQLIVINGVRILGLGGSMRYKDGPLQYTEADMVKRVKKLRRSIDKHKGFDVLLTHSPAAGIGDGDDLCHTGFKIFRQLLDVYKPSYFLHGHQHLNYNVNAKRLRDYNDTTIINGYEYHMFEYQSNNMTYNKKTDPHLNFKIIKEQKLS